MWLVTGSTQGATAGEQHVISRESDLLVLRRFLGSGKVVACLVLSGEVGIGKTTLWESGIEIAAAQGYVVLSARASEAEVSLSFASLADLVDSVDPEVLDSLPAPQLQALEVALRRRAPVEAAPDPFAVSAGFLSTLRALSERGPVLVAVDDIQWLDPSSSDALLFAARRLSDGQIRFLITRRSGRESDLERAMPPSLVERLEVTPLSFGATARVLLERLGPVLTHRVLRRVHATSHGNPLFALELGRLLVAGGIPDIGAELPTPHLVDDLFGQRVRELPDAARKALLAVALSAGLSISELSMIVDPLALEDEIASGLLAVDRSRVRPAHPMLAAAVRRQSSARERRDLHLELAAVVGDPTLRARHLAVATVVPSRDVARTVAEAADIAASRGSVQDAQELGTHALRLTPPGAPERADRMLALGRFHSRADDMTRVTDLLTEGMSELPPGRARAMAHLLLGDAADIAGDEAHAELALAEAGEDPEIRALALAKKSRLLVVSDIRRIDRAEEWALEALSAAQQVGAEVDETARTALAWARVFRGRPIDDLSRPQPGSGLRRLPEASIDRAVSARLTFRGECDKARGILLRLLALATESGDVQSARLSQQMLCELELRAGHVPETGALLDELGHGLQLYRGVQARLQALLAAVTGIPKEARRWAAEVLETGSGYTQGWDRLEATRAIGMAALFERDAARAVESLRAVWEHTLREHVDDPGALPVAPDLVEALASSGDVASAEGVTELLRRSAVEQEHPWGLASAKRCSAVVQLADRYLDEAAGQLEEAAADYGELGLSFDRARTLLYLGALQRRAQKRAAARRSLEAATAQFDECGCSGWATRARSELAQVSGRRSADEGELTPSEYQVVEMAASGLSNKEIAARLFVAVNTVEVHLSHAYAKLGISSRSQLPKSLGKSNPQR
jgi:DNA-binding CsgD family transcriptional regulator